MRNKDGGKAAEREGEKERERERERKKERERERLVNILHNNVN